MVAKLNCEQAQKHFGAALSREIGSRNERALRYHLRGCQDCAESFKEFSAAWDLLGRWDDEVPPVSLEGRVRGRIAEAMRVDAFAETSGGIRLGREVFLPVVLGILATLVSVAATLWKVESGPRPLSALVVSAAIWSGLYIGVFLAIFRRARFGGMDVGRLATLALTGNAGALLFFSLCPISSEEGVCRMLPFMRQFFEVGGGTPAYFILGVMSAILPIYFLTAIVGKRVEAAAGSAAIIIGIIVALLIMPALALQKAPLTLEIMALALGSAALGLFAGSFLGTLAGLWTTSRVGATHAA
ncbi:MAG: zf-HC2 domain-containing protein [Myxococcota bacterium]